MAKELFGTDGIRGVPGTPPLDDQTLFATGRALGGFLRREHGSAHALIGMDNSSPMSKLRPPTVQSHPGGA